VTRWDEPDEPDARRTINDLALVAVVLGAAPGSALAVP
jgi:hypothetical protein